MPARNRLPLIAIAVTLVLWASAFVAIRHLGDTFSPGALSLGRLLVGSVALGVLVLRQHWVPVDRGQGVRLVAIGLLWFGFYNVALNAGERRVDAGTAALLIQVSPILVAFLAAAFLGERATRWLWIGSVVSFAGVALIATSAQGDADRDPAGVLLCVLAAAAYAVSIVLQKPLMARLSAVQVTWAACTVGALACLPFAGSLLDQWQAASGADRAYLVYLGLFPTAIAFTTYAFALRHMATARLSVTTYLVPPITVLLSATLLSETPPAIAYAGGALALVGVSLTRRTDRVRVTAAQEGTLPA
jgi:drug/metabolite transporter (DMT)-like permease